VRSEHPAPFPEDIITLPILQTSKEFELVLDPFMGSGTVGRVCDVFWEDVLLDMI
jgi:DNA modification methylase